MMRLLCMKGRYNLDNHRVVLGDSHFRGNDLGCMGMTLGV